MNNAMIGTLAGTVATAPMTLFMEAMHRKLPMRQRYALPPRQIVESLAHKAGVRQHLSPRQRFWISMAAHFGYGGAAGMLFAPVATQLKTPTAASGVVFGLCVWTGSYLGVLPGLGILSPATEHPVRRNLLMIFAHVVWGASLGWLVDRLRGDVDRR